MGVFFKDTGTTEIYTNGHTLSLHDALPIFIASRPAWRYRSLAPLDAAARASLAETRRYESVDLRPLDLTFRSRGDDGPLMLTVAGDSSADKVREYIAVAKEMVDAGWTLHVLASTRLARSEEHTSELQSLMRISY